MSTLKGLVEKVSREASGRVVEMLGEQPSVWEIMKEEASAREGFAALTSPEAEGKRRREEGPPDMSTGAFRTHLLCSVDQDAGSRTWECRAMKCRGSRC